MSDCADECEICGKRIEPAYLSLAPALAKSVGLLRGFGTEHALHHDNSIFRLGCGDCVPQLLLMNRGDPTLVVQGGIKDHHPPVMLRIVWHGLITNSYYYVNILDSKFIAASSKYFTVAFIPPGYDTETVLVTSINMQTGFSSLYVVRQYAYHTTETQENAASFVCTEDRVSEKKAGGVSDQMAKELAMCAIVDSGAVSGLSPLTFAAYDKIMGLYSSRYRQYKKDVQLNTEARGNMDDAVVGVVKKEGAVVIGTKFRNAIADLKPYLDAIEALVTNQSTILNGLQSWKVNEIRDAINKQYKHVTAEYLAGGTVEDVPGVITTVYSRMRREVNNVDVLTGRGGLRFEQVRVELVKKYDAEDERIRTEYCLPAVDRAFTLVVI